MILDNDFQTCPCGCSVWSTGARDDPALGEVMERTCIMCGYSLSVYSASQRAIIEEWEAEDEAERERALSEYYDELEAEAIWYSVWVDNVSGFGGKTLEAALDAARTYAPGKHVEIRRKDMRFDEDGEVVFEGVA